jgi:hypothetical protein
MPSTLLFADFDVWLDENVAVSNPRTGKYHCDCGTDENWIMEEVATRYDPEGWVSLSAICLACGAGMSFGNRPADESYK